MLRERIHFVTANHYQLQGLRLVPLGLFLWLVGAAYRGWFDWLPSRPVHEPLDRGGAWGPLAFFAALACALAATNYYKGRYGAVGQFDRHRRNWLLGAAIVAFFVLARIDARLDWPVRLNFLLISLSLFTTVWVDGWVRAHYLFGALAWLAVSLLPAFQATPPTALLACYGAGGLTLIVCGIGDHLLMTRTLLDTRKAIDASAATVI